MNEHSHKNDPVTRFLELSCLSYSQTDGLDRIQAARDMLVQQPELARKNVWTASCTGDMEALKMLLDASPALVRLKGGPFEWEPLLYAAYSRLNLPGRSTLDAARLLLKNRADPNAHWMWGGQYRFTVLTGAFGEGESGPVHQPPHQDCEALARLLLEAGADPNDSQALYNTMFTPGNRCLEILLEFGLGPEAKCNWLVGSPPNLQPNPQRTLHYQMMWAIRKFHASRARLLMKHGADVTESDGRQTPWKAAVLAGHLEIIEDLMRHGAREESLSSVEAFAAACMAGDHEHASRLAVEDAGLCESTQRAMPELLLNAASSDRREAVRCLVNAGWDPNAMPHGNSALHQAAWNGHLKMAMLLVELGARPDLRDKAHDATAADWAEHSGHSDVAVYLANLA